MYGYEKIQKEKDPPPKKKKSGQVNGDDAVSIQPVLALRSSRVITRVP